MTIDLTEPIMYLIQFVVAIALSYIARNKQKNSNYKRELELVGIAVGAAEQLYRSGMVSDRKKFVLERLESMGVKLDADRLDLAIENEVNKLQSIADRLPKETIDGSGIGYDS